MLYLARQGSLTTNSFNSVYIQNVVHGFKKTVKLKVESS